MNLIATVDKNWAIGKQGHLLVNIPEDIKLFRMETAGKAAIMGRKTYEQITDRTALIDRYNVVLTSDLSYKKDGVVVVHSVEEALEKVASYKSEDIYVIGGESVFEQFGQLESEEYTEDGIKVLAYVPKEIEGKL